MTGEIADAFGDVGAQPRWSGVASRTEVADEQQQDGGRDGVRDGAAGE